MVVEDVTPEQAPSQARSSRKVPKVVMGEFADVDAVSLAQFGRKVYRFLACTENMLPANGTVLYPHFHSYMTDHQDDPYYADALKRVGDKGVYLRKRLLCYVISLSFL